MSAQDPVDVPASRPVIIFSSVSGRKITAEDLYQLKLWRECLY